MPHFTPISYLELPADDLHKIKIFYSQAFDWRFTDYGPDYSSFQNSGINGGFYRAQKASNTDNGGALIVLYAPAIEECKHRVIGAGGIIKTDIFAFPGGRRFHFNDPCHNELAVWTDILGDEHA